MLRQRPSRIKPHLVNAGLAAASLVLGYVLLEVAVFRLFLPFVPVGLRPDLPEVADVLVQKTKLGYLPHDYVALLGDSYAEGRGDWLLAAGGDRAAPFHSADVIHAASGRDVVSFGRGGASSAEGIVLLPARALPKTRCVLFPRIEMPRQIFVYFYEGNDIEDNLNFAAKVEPDFSRLTPEQIDGYLDAHYAAESSWRCHLALLDSASRMVQFLYQHYVSGLDLEYCGVNEPQANRIVVDGQSLDAPALQGPAVPLSDKLIQIGMDVLDRSLSWLQRRFEDVPITVVYIPSPLSVYRIAGETEVYCRSSRTGSADVARSQRNSDLMSGLVQKIATSKGMGFIDARPALRSVAATTLIHGPRDWDHLNEAGYRALGLLVAAHVKALPPN